MAKGSNRDPLSFTRTPDFDIKPINGADILGWNHKCLCGIERAIEGVANEEHHPSCPRSLERIAKRRLVKSRPLIYVAGSLRRRDRILEAVQALESEGIETFYDWIMPGEETDAKWQSFEESLGHDYEYAMNRAHARDVFNFDKRWLDRADGVLLTLPAGKSAHLELGYTLGTGRPGFIWLDGEPERWDVMYLFATLVTKRLEDIIAWCKNGISQKSTD